MVIEVHPSRQTQDAPMHFAYVVTEILFLTATKDSVVAGHVRMRDSGARVEKFSSTTEFQRRSECLSAS